MVNRLNNNMSKYIDRECVTHGVTEFVLEGRGYYRCKKCRSLRVANTRRKNKKTLSSEFGSCCLICGYNKYVGALHFHHLNPKEKSFSLSHSGICKSIKRMREEAKKCILVCANCHSEIEAGITPIPE